MSLKVEVIAKKVGKPKDLYPRLMLHKPTGSVILQFTERDAVKLVNGPDAPSWSKSHGPEWLITSQENYIPWVGKLTLEND